jgi:hypothetical protein
MFYYLFYFSCGFFFLHSKLPLIASDLEIEKDKEQKKNTVENVKIYQQNKENGLVFLLFPFRLGGFFFFCFVGSRIACEFYFSMRVQQELNANQEKFNKNDVTSEIDGEKKRLTFQIEFVCFLMHAMVLVLPETRLLCDFILEC